MLREEFRYVVITDPSSPQPPEEPEFEEVTVTGDVYNAYVGVSFDLQLGEGLFVRSFPSWLSADESTGIIEGTPTQAGTYEFIVEYEDGSAERNILIVGDEAPDRFVVTFILGQSGDFGLYTPEPGLSFTIEGDLPPGVSFNPEDAGTEGVPEATGTFDFDFVVTDASGEEVFRDEFRFVIIADPSSTQPEEESPSEEPDITLRASLGDPYEHLLWQPEDAIGHSIVGALPDGLSFDEERIAITGTPTQVGTTDFVHLLTYEDGREVRGRLRIVVQ